MVTVLPKKDGCSFPKEVHITAIKTENNCIRRCLGKCILQRPVPVQQSPVPACLMHTKALSTEDTQDEERGGGGGETTYETAFSNVGRKINTRYHSRAGQRPHAQSERHQAQAAERDLRLVQRGPRVERAQYQLLTGSQITRCGCGSERWRGPSSSWDPPWQRRWLFLQMLGNVIWIQRVNRF